MSPGWRGLNGQARGRGEWSRRGPNCRPGHQPRRWPPSREGRSSHRLRERGRTQARPSAGRSGRAAQRWTSRRRRESPGPDRRRESHPSIHCVPLNREVSRTEDGPGSPAASGHSQRRLRSPGVSPPSPPSTPAPLRQPPPGGVQTPRRPHELDDLQHGFRLGRDCLGPRSGSVLVCAHYPRSRATVECSTLLPAGPRSRSTHALLAASTLSTSSRFVRATVCAGSACTVSRQ